MVLTRNINAKRLARMVTTPVIAGVSTMLYDFRTDSQQYAMCFPELKGQPWKNVPFMFDTATVLGVFPASGELIMNVSPGYVMQARRQLCSPHSCSCPRLPGPAAPCSASPVLTPATSHLTLLPHRSEANTRSQPVSAAVRARRWTTTCCCCVPRGCTRARSECGRRLSARRWAAGNRPS